MEKEGYNVIVKTRRYKVQFYLNYPTDFISAESKISSCNCQAWQREREKYKNKGDKKGRREAYFCYLIEKCVYMS